MPRFNPPAPAATRPIVRCTVTSVTQSQICETVMDWQSDAVAPLTATEINGFLAQWDTAFKALYLACVSPKTALVNRMAADIFTGITPTAITVDAPGVIGTAGTNNLPIEVAANIQKTSGLKGQHGRGRVSMPAVPDSFTTPATSPNDLNAAGITAYGNLFTAMEAGIVSFGITYVPCICTRPVPPASLVGFAVNVQSFVVRVGLSTQRRRKVGRGI